MTVNLLAADRLGATLLTANGELIQAAAPVARAAIMPAADAAVAVSRVLVHSSNLPFDLHRR
jgi:hypothetical protein